VRKTWHFVIQGKRVTVGVLLRTAEQQYDARTSEMQTDANVLAPGIATAMSVGSIGDVTRTLNAIATTHLLMPL